MKFALKKERYRRSSLPPSLQAEGLFCTRKLWLKVNHFEMHEHLQLKSKVFELKNHLKEEWKKSWYFEIRLQSGARVDAWIPDEHVLVEFKTDKPHAKHLYQVWMLMEELQVLAITGAEFQLWYPLKWKDEVEKLAESMGLEWAINAGEMAAIATDEPDTDFKVRRERDTAVMLSSLDNEQPPISKNPESSPCKRCSYFEFCHC